jgi:hypothetical protein
MLALYNTVLLARKQKLKAQSMLIEEEGGGSDVPEV